MSRGLFGAVVKGVPTEEDVKLLMASFGTIEAGVTVTYEEIEKVAQIKRRTPRWQVVTNAWRQRLQRELNCRIVAIRGVGFKRLEERDRSDRSTKDMLDRLGGAVRYIDDVKRVNSVNFNEADLRVHHHRVNVTTRIKENLFESAREIAPPRPVKSLPRMVIGK